MPVAAFVAPYLLEATARFVDAAARLEGVRLGLVTQEPLDRLPPALRNALAGHWRVENALDPRQIAAAVHGLTGQLGHVERLVGTLEQLQVPLGEVRQALRIPGMDAETARNFRDKSRMKDVLQAAGVPCARHRLVRSPEEARRFVDVVGFPIVAKPPAGAGAQGTFRLDDDTAFGTWAASLAPSHEAPVLLEEFLVGDEHSFDSVMVEGRLVWASVARYLPPPLEVLRNPWMQWVVLLPRDIGVDAFDAIRSAGPAALRALGMHTGLSHMEWFRREDGSVAVSEVGARPPGAQITTLLSFAHDVDFYEAWARLAILDRFDAPERRWAVGAVYLRAQRPAPASAGTPAGPERAAEQVAAIEGLEEMQRQVGALVVEARLPQPGQPVSASYEGDGHVIVRHEDTAVVVDALQRLLQGLRVHAG